MSNKIDVLRTEIGELVWCGRLGPCYVEIKRSYDKFYQDMIVRDMRGRLHEVDSDKVTRTPGRKWLEDQQINRRKARQLDQLMIKSN